MNASPNDPRVDDLRKQLRALGYLDAGVDRFVLGPARGARRPSAIAALASLRVGILAAALLGPAAAIGLRTRLPGLVTGAQDAMVIALYLGALFGIAAVIFSFAASMLVARLTATADARRARLMSRAAGTVVAVGCLAYLTLWWRSASAELAWTTPGWTTVVLLVAVLISLLLGHAVSITTFAVIAARTHMQQTGDVSRSTRRLVFAAGVLAFAGAAGLLVLAAPETRSEAPDAPRLAVVSPGARVRVIAIDGFDPEVFDHLRSASRVPALAARFARGRVRIAADAARDPARAWTTVATGQPPAVHGVQSLETRRVAGVQGTVASGEGAGLERAIRGATDLLRLTRPSIASGVELRAKPFWEVASDGGLRVAVVNWWATWPAAGTGPHPPAILSDRAMLRLERGGALDGEIAPQAVYEQLRNDWPVLKKMVAAKLDQQLPRTTDPAIDAILRRSAELDSLQLALLQRFYGQAPDLMAVYLPGLDIAQHSLLTPAEGAGPTALAARLEAIRRYYVFLDGLLQDVFGDSPDNLAVLITQPGRQSSASFGTLTVSGAFAAATIDGEIAAVDVAPTVLHALGVPVSRDLAGRPALQLFTRAFAAKFPVREIATYGERRAEGAVRQGQPLDDEMVERLRSLGYVR